MSNPSQSTVHPDRQSDGDCLLRVPIGVGRAIVEAASLRACPLLGTDRFLKFCADRGLRIDRERLLRLERLGLFAPVFRVCTPLEGEVGQFRIPIENERNWFDDGWAWDTTGVPAQHLPVSSDREQEGYYSIFQLDYLRIVLVEMTLSVHLDSYLESGKTIGSREWTKWANQFADGLRSHEFRRAIALLCQYISDRYYFRTQGDQRTIRTGGGIDFDSWIEVNAVNWEWYEYSRAWQPHVVERLFDLTPVKLRHAYETLASAQSWVDPLERWHQLVQFVSLDRRQRLKGDALLAQSLREGAMMLRWLHQDLYAEELPLPNEIHGTVITHIPELEVRKDARRYLEFVVNAYGLNPRPKLVLILEGPSEERLVSRFFDEVFGFPPGRCGIELLVIHSVDNATGGKADRYRAILRLIDYLHHHQTLVYLVLDNEGYAKRLKGEINRARSIHRHRHRVSRPEYIRIWRRTFEFDNFSDTEIASALNKVAVGYGHFDRQQVASCRADRSPGSMFKRIYEDAIGSSIPKVKLADALFESMVDPESRRAVENRPISCVLRRVVELAVKNPFPVMQEIWAKNQQSKVLAKKS